jgi:uncharacterized protein (DUF885 family)
MVHEKFVFLASVVSFATGFCWALPARAQQAALDQAADKYWDFSMRRSPTRATAIGDYRFNDQLDDLSAAAEERFASELKSLQGELRGVQTKDLNEESKLTYALLQRAIDDDLTRMNLKIDRLLALEPLEGPHLRLPLILVSHPLRNADDFQTFIKRLRAFPRQVDDLIANLKEGVSQGVSSPRVIVAKTIPQIREQAVDDPQKSPLHDVLKKINVVPEAQRAEIQKAVTDAIRDDVVPAYRKLLKFAEEEYMPMCRETVGLIAVPGGPAMYEKLAALNATVMVKPDDVHALGLSEVERIRGEMAKIQKEVDFPGSLDAFLEKMRTDPKFRFASRDELFETSGNILMRAKSKMPKLFGKLPKADCVMKEIESFRAPASPVAYYNPPAEDGSRPGYYYINTYKPEERLKFTLEALTYHEAVPGHHLQIALDQENTTLPKFRRYGGYTAYVEGWALYTEKLGYEIDGYRGPYNRFGQLTFEMWRACRLVVDTGMHAKNWTREQAIEFMAKNTSLAAVDITNEVDRYISWPGQALGYKIGELRILALRAEAEKKLGEKFDLRSFHDALLSGGPMPIDTLETRMRAWINKEIG